MHFPAELSSWSNSPTCDFLTMLKTLISMLRCVWDTLRLEYVCIKVTAPHLHVRQGSQGAEQGHGFPGARRPTEHQRLVFGQPGVEQSFVPHRVQSGHHHVRRRHLVRLHLDLRHLPLPRLPLARDAHLRIQSSVSVTHSPHTHTRAETASARTS